MQELLAHLQHAVADLRGDVAHGPRAARQEHRGVAGVCAHVLEGVEVLQGAQTAWGICRQGSLHDSLPRKANPVTDCAEAGADDRGHLHAVASCCQEQTSRTLRRLGPESHLGDHHELHGREPHQVSTGASDLQLPMQVAQWEHC